MCHRPYTFDKTDKVLYLIFAVSISLPLYRWQFLFPSLLHLFWIFKIVVSIFVSKKCFLVRETTAILMSCRVAETSYNACKQSFLNSRLLRMQILCALICVQLYLYSFLYCAFYYFVQRVIKCDCHLDHRCSWLSHYQKC